jgi:GNAT superfamily N-acetyltransferase
VNAVIRKAVASDCKLILKMIRELALFEKMLDDVSATEEKLRQQLFGSNPVAHVLMAEYEGTVCGFALYFYNFSTFLARSGIYLEDLYVQESMRSYGVGKALLTKLAQLAKEENCGRLEWSVLKWNTNAIRFYLKIGAVPLEEWSVYRLDESAIAKLASAAD